jgi:molecular chaperone DnaK
LSKEEADRMKKEADSHAAEDKAKLAEVEARNRLDNLVYQTEKVVKDNRDKLAEADVKSAEDAIAEARTALSGTDVDKMNAAVDSLTKASHHIAETMYKAQQASGAAAGAGADGGGQAGSAGANANANNSGQGDVVDAEFVDVDDSKKPN